MSTVLPSDLLPECLKRGMVMPQLTLQVPSKSSVTFTAKVEPLYALIVVGFSFTGKDVNGNAISGYNFVTNEGIIWKGVYRQIPDLLPDYEAPEFYITDDYLNKYVPYGPRVVSKELEVTIVNNYSVDVLFTQTLYGYQIPLEDLLTVLNVPRSEWDNILRLSV